MLNEGNFSYQNPLDRAQENEVITRGNFTQLLPDTEILVGVSLVINGGNWVNVKPQVNWIINGGNWATVDRCSHVNPWLVEHGLEVCPENCRHVVSLDEIVVDNMLIDTVYQYEETVL